MVDDLHWLVVYLPLWKNDGVRHLGWWFHSQLNGKSSKFHGSSRSSHHQPVICSTIRRLLQLAGQFLEFFRLLFQLTFLTSPWSEDGNDDWNDQRLVGTFNLVSYKICIYNTVYLLCIYIYMYIHIYIYTIYICIRYIYIYIYKHISISLSLSYCILYSII